MDAVRYFDTRRRASRPLSLDFSLCWAAVPILIALSGCASKPEIAVDSYCTIKPTELIDMRDPGLQRLTPVNQGAVLTADDNYGRLCLKATNKGR